GDRGAARAAFARALAADPRSYGAMMRAYLALLDGDPAASSMFAALAPTPPADAPWWRLLEVADAELGRGSLDRARGYLERALVQQRAPILLRRLAWANAHR